MGAEGDAVVHHGGGTEANEDNQGFHSVLRQDNQDDEMTKQQQHAVQHRGLLLALLHIT